MSWEDKMALEKVCYPLRVLVRQLIAPWQTFKWVSTSLPASQILIPVRVHQSMSHVHTLSRCSLTHTSLTELLLFLHLPA